MFVRVFFLSFVIAIGSVYGFGFGARWLQQIIHASNVSDLSSGSLARGVLLDNEITNLTWLDSYLYSPTLLLYAALASLVVALFGLLGTYLHIYNLRLFLYVLFGKRTRGMSFRAIRHRP